MRFALHLYKPTRAGKLPACRSDEIRDPHNLIARTLTRLRSINRSKKIGRASTHTVGTGALFYREKKTMRDSENVLRRIAVTGVLISSLMLGSVAPSFANASSNELASTPEEQKAVAITIYNVNLG